MATTFDNLFTPGAPISVPSISADENSFIATPVEQKRIAGSDAGWMDSLLRVVGVGASAYATVKAAEAQAAASRPQSVANEARAASAPVIAASPSSASSLPAWVKPVAIGAGILAAIGILWGFMRGGRRK